MNNNRGRGCCGEDIKRAVNAPLAVHVMHSIATQLLSQHEVLDSQAATGEVVKVFELLLSRGVTDSASRQLCTDAIDRLLEGGLLSLTAREGLTKFLDVTQIQSHRLIQKTANSNSDAERRVAIQVLVSATKMCSALSDTAEVHKSVERTLAFVAKKIKNEVAQMRYDVIMMVLDTLGSQALCTSKARNSLLEIVTDTLEAPGMCIALYLAPHRRGV